MKKNPLRVGLIGCGNICGIYLNNAAILPDIEIIALADADNARAQAKAKEFNIPRALSVDALLGDPQVECVLNLTPPAAHASIAKAALSAGKHIYNEKPLAIELADCAAILALAEQKKLRVGCAPDTFMGAGLQTCCDAIDRGLIGVPVGGTAFMMYGGPESWHPSPEFFFKKGAGPMFDMGPYYLTAFITMLGPVKRVSGSARITHATRTITSEPLKGTVITVDTPTHISGLIEFTKGETVTLTTSFDVPHHTLPCIELFGSEGTIRVPDPNGFGDPVRIKHKDDKDWSELPHVHTFSKNWRGIGLNDMARAIRGMQHAHAASGQLAHHVTACMHGFLRSSDEGRRLNIEVPAVRPNPWHPDDALQAALAQRKHE